MAGRPTGRVLQEVLSSGAFAVVEARRGHGRLLAAAAAVVALVALPAGAQVLTQVSVVQPGSGAAVSAPLVVVEVRGLNQAESVQARLIAGGQERVGALSGPENLATGSRWRGNLDVSGLPNGAARVEARAQLSGSGNLTDWSGHDVRLDLPAPPIGLNIAVVQADAITLSWGHPGIPDVSGYELQRALAGQGYEPLAAVEGEQLAHTDVGVPAGDHRYRARAVRPGAGGGSRPGPWAEATVSLVGGAPGGPPPEGAGDGSQPTSGVAARPPTGGGISARLRAGTEGVELPQGPSLNPLVAPRDHIFDEHFAVAPPADPGTEELARGGGARLSVSREDDGPLGSDAVRLVGLGVAGLLALRARRITQPGRSPRALR